LVSVYKIERSAGVLRGKGLALGGVVTSVIGLIFGVVAAAMTLAFLLVLPRALQMPATSFAPPQAWNEQAAANLYELSKAAFGYASLNDGCLPPADTWQTDLAPYLRDDTGQVMAWPASQGLAYSMNRAVSGMKLNDIPHPERTVLFFIAASGAPAAGGPEDVVAIENGMRAVGSPSARYFVAFVDGHTEEVVPPIPGGWPGDLTWDPNEAPSQP
jgi:hypothetical protein